MLVTGFEARKRSGATTPARHRRTAVIHSLEEGESEGQPPRAVLALSAIEANTPERRWFEMAVHAVWERYLTVIRRASHYHGERAFAR